MDPEAEAEAVRVLRSWHSIVPGREGHARTKTALVRGGSLVDAAPVQAPAATNNGKPSVVQVGSQVEATAVHAPAAVE